jgi:preprotein translocase subunit SecG
VQTLILSLHVIVCVSLVILVLLQAGKEGMGVIFGGGSGTVFGSSGAGGMLSKLTAFMAVLFILTSLSYNIITSSRPDDKSTILDVKLEDSAPTKGPAAPATPADTKAPVDPLDQTSGKK